MYHEVIFIIALVRYAEVTEGYIADYRIKEAVRNLRLFKRLLSDRGLLVELLCYSCGYRIDLNAEYTALTHGLRQQTDKVTDAA